MNGSRPEAPDGGHNTQAEALLDAAPVALPDDPPELAAAFAPPRRGEMLVGAAPDPAVAVRAALDDVDCAVAVFTAVVGVVVAAPLTVFVPVAAAVETTALLPSLTAPSVITL